MKKQLFFLALSIAFIGVSTLKAMDVALPKLPKALEDKIQEQMRKVILQKEELQKAYAVYLPFFTNITETFSRGELTREYIHQQYEAIIKPNQSKFFSTILDAWLNGEESNSLFGYLKTMAQKRELKEKLSAAEFNQVIALIDLGTSGNKNRIRDLYAKSINWG